MTKPLPIWPMQGLLWTAYALHGGEHFPGVHVFLSAYANSVTMVCCFCMGVVMAWHLMWERKLLRARDWYDDYNIKADFYCNPDFFQKESTPASFFIRKKWDKDNLFQEYLGQEKNSYVLE